METVLDRLPDKPRADMFGRYILPRCQEAGLWDERLQMLYELKLIDLGDKPPSPPPPGHEGKFQRHPWDEAEPGGTPPAS